MKKVVAPASPETISADTCTNFPEKKVWETPELSGFSIGEHTRAGANLRTTEDTVGDNYRPS